MMLPNFLRGIISVFLNMMKRKFYRSSKNKTLFMVFFSDGEIIFFEKKGDYRKYNAINMSDDRYSIFYKESTEMLDIIFMMENSHMLEPTKNWNYFVKIMCNFRYEAAFKKIMKNIK